MEDDVSIWICFCMVAIACFAIGWVLADATIQQNEIDEEKQKRRENETG